MTGQAGIDPSVEEIASSARLLRMAAYTLLVTGALLVVAGGLALFYLGVQGLSFLPLIALVALVEFAAGLFLRRRARAMLQALRGPMEDEQKGSG